MARLRWLRTGRDDLRAIRRYVARDSPAQAQALVERVRSAVERLQAFPESGRIVPEYGLNQLREVISHHTEWSTAIFPSGSSSRWWQ